MTRLMNSIENKDILDHDIMIPCFNLKGCNQSIQYNSDLGGVMNYDVNFNYSSNLRNALEIRESENTTII